MLSGDELLSGLFRPKAILLSMNSAVHGGLHIRQGLDVCYPRSIDRRYGIGGTAVRQRERRRDDTTTKNASQQSQKQQSRCMQGLARLQRSLATGWVGRQGSSACQHINASWLGEWFAGVNRLVGAGRMTGERRRWGSLFLGSELNVAKHNVRASVQFSESSFTYSKIQKARRPVACPIAKSPNCPMIAPVRDL